jgi:acetyl-CoA decarbonylase/synthase complex subunit epsilon
MTTPWQKTSFGGPMQGKEVSADVAARIINKSENPLMIVGPEIADLGEAMEKVLKLSEKGIPIIATAHALKYLTGKHDVSWMGLVEITDLLRDPEWKGINGRPHDLAIFIGIRYGLLSQMLSTLKNFTDITTVNLSRYFQPNASFSFPNITDDIWLEYLDELCEKLEG